MAIKSIRIPPYGVEVKAAEEQEIATFSTTSTTFVDITNLTTNIVITKTCTIIAIVSCSLYNNNAVGQTKLKIDIGGTGGGETRILGAEAGANQDQPVTTMFVRTAVPAGTITIKGQLAVSNGAHTGSFYRVADSVENALTVIAIEE